MSCLIRGSYGRSFARGPSFETSPFVVTWPGRELPMASLRKFLRLLFGAALSICMVVSGCSDGAQPTLAASRAQIGLGCSKHADCEDGDPCTQNLCAAGLCAAALPVLGCCFDG